MQGAHKRHVAWYGPDQVHQPEHRYIRTWESCSLMRVGQLRFESPYKYVTIGFAGECPHCYMFEDRHSIFTWTETTVSNLPLFHAHLLYCKRRGRWETRTTYNVNTIRCAYTLVNCLMRKYSNATVLFIYEFASSRTSGVCMSPMVWISVLSKMPCFSRYI